MSVFLRSAALAVLISAGSTHAQATSGTGITTRYWDCCKPSCAWNDLSSLGIDSAVNTCDVQDQPMSDTSAQSGCQGGTAYESFNLIMRYQDAPNKSLGTCAQTNPLGLSRTTSPTVLPPSPRPVLPAASATSSPSLAVLLPARK